MSKLLKRKQALVRTDYCNWTADDHRFAGVYLPELNNAQLIELALQNQELLNSIMTKLNKGSE